VTAPLSVLATLAVVGGMKELIADCEKVVGRSIQPIFGPTRDLLERIEGGGVADVAILTDAAIDALLAAGKLAGHRIDLARSFIGVAVRAGAQWPDISTPAALRETLVGANSIVFSAAGASGIFFAELIDRLGVGGIVRAKATVIPTGFTGELVASGSVELAVQQVSELMVVPGIDIVGRLPEALHGGAVFSGGVFASAGPGAMTLLEYLASEPAGAVFRRHGLEPIRPT
jgi:molybdate transport system substrate-binding protein